MELNAVSSSPASDIPSPLFESRFTMSQKLYQEYCRHAISLSYRIVCCTVAVLLLLLAVTYLIRFSFHYWGTACFYAAGAVFMFIWPYLSSLRSAKRLTARQELLSKNNSIEHIVQFFDLRSEILSSSQPVQFCYEQITRFVETPSLYCLFMGKTMCTIVKKDSFTIGNPMEFKAFLRTKCPQLKIK